jgi:uncharacterized protein (TIGR00251 family)
MNLLQHILQFGTRVVRIKIKVTPSSPKDEITGVMSDGTIKIRIHAAPEHGKANAKLIQFLKSETGIPESHIDIIRGQTSHQKEVAFDTSKCPPLS